jgi:hypothetical protein
MGIRVARRLGDNAEPPRSRDRLVVDPPTGELLRPMTGVDGWSRYRL